jgi:hypothetical protein
MEILFFFAILCLLAFMILATYDGVYLHLWKYELFAHLESRFEHLTHTIRAVLFPLIIWFLFIETDVLSFRIGVSLMLIDLLVLGIDAYSEKDSRTFMGGLPRWEYILHLFANSLHFATFMLIIATKVVLTEQTLVYSDAFLAVESFALVQLIAINVIPGSILLALAHVWLATQAGQRLWHKYRLKITCC